MLLYNHNKGKHKNKATRQEVEKMRWPKEFERVSGQKVRLAGTKIYIYQWNTGKNKNFMVEQLGLSIHQQDTWTIPGKGDEAMKAAIEKAKSLA